MKFEVRVYDAFRARARALDETRTVCDA